MTELVTYFYNPIRRRPLKDRLAQPDQGRTLQDQGYLVPLTAEQQAVWDRLAKLFPYCRPETLKKIGKQSVVLEKFGYGKSNEGMMRRSLFGDGTILGDRDTTVSAGAFYGYLAQRCTCDICDHQAREIEVQHFGINRWFKVIIKCCGQREEIELTEIEARYLVDNHLRAYAFIEPKKQAARDWISDALFKQQTNRLLPQHALSNRERIHRKVPQRKHLPNRNPAAEKANSPTRDQRPADRRIETAMHGEADGGLEPKCLTASAGEGGSHVRTGLLYERPSSCAERVWRWLLSRKSDKKPTRHAT